MCMSASCACSACRIQTKPSPGCGYWELNQGPVNTEPSPQPPDQLLTLVLKVKLLILMFIWVATLTLKINKVFSWHLGKKEKKPLTPRNTCKVQARLLIRDILSWAFPSQLPTGTSCSRQTALLGQPFRGSELVCF